MRGVPGGKHLVRIGSFVFDRRNQTLEGPDRDLRLDRRIGFQNDLVDSAVRSRNPAFLKGGLTREGVSLGGGLHHRLLLPRLRHHFDQNVSCFRRTAHFLRKWWRKRGKSERWCNPPPRETPS